jgi:hypothetical protein
MVYMDADNNLDQVSPYDLQEMQAVGSTANVTVLVQYDTRGATTRRYKVEKGSMSLLADLGEQDMADPATLRAFITSSVAAYPASHYALVLWGHGNGWKSDSLRKTKSIFVDWTNNGTSAPATSNHLVGQAILAAEKSAGITLDILGIDACVMATMEAAYEFRDTAGIMVSSQDLVQEFGWDYKDLLGRLAASPTMTPRVLAANMVDSYRQYVESSAYGYGDQTISALQLGSGIDLLAQKVNTLALDLMVKMTDPTTRDTTLTTITTARAAVREFDNSVNPATYVDLADFSRLLEGNNSPIQKQLAEVVIAEYHGSLRPGAHGLSIVFYDLPRALAYSSSVYDPNYKNYDTATGTGSTSTFINDFSWDEMMHSYFGYQYPTLDN